MGIETAILGAATVAGSAIQAGAAGKAADAQTAAANKDIEFQRETRDIVRKDLEPYRGAGSNALSVYEYLLGLNPETPMLGATPLDITEVTESAAPSGQGNWSFGTGLPAGIKAITGGPGTVAGIYGNTTKYQVGDQVFDTREEAEAYANANATGGTPYGGFETSPGYEWQLGQGQDAINALAGARGGLVSGRTLQDLATYNQGLASQEWDKYLSRVGGLVDTGMNASTISGQASQNAAAGVSNALAGIGNAQAAGAIAGGNAWNSGINNLIGIWQYQNALTNGTA
jgi:hypothetical protein